MTTCQSRTGSERSQRRSRCTHAGGLLLLLLLCAGLGSGCARTPQGPAFEWAPPPPDHRGRVYLYRVDPIANLSTVRVQIDGRGIGDFQPGEYETVELAAGNHRLAAGMRGFALLSWGWNEHQFSIEPGETVFLELSVRLDDQHERNIPPPSSLEIFGRAEGQARQNVFILTISRAEAQELLPSMKRLTP